MNRTQALRMAKANRERKVKASTQVWRFIDGCLLPPLPAGTIIPASGHKPEMVITEFRNE